MWLLSWIVVCDWGIHDSTAIHTAAARGHVGGVATHLSQNNKDGTVRYRPACPPTAQRFSCVPGMPGS